MPSYRAPLRDIRFVLTELLDAGQLTRLPGYEEATPELLLQVLEEGARFCEEVLFPLNQPGDIEGCRYEDGVVRAPAGFREAYAQYVAGGWAGITCDPDFGGQGLPHLVGFIWEELLHSANLSFAMYPGLTHGAYSGIAAHGSEELKRRYLPKLVSGEWAGTMCLTESHAGTDLGIIRTKAVPGGDGAYRITGTKIFITAGEHDLAENIVHLVLAKLPGAPPGTRGISMFLVPKFLPTDEGRPGTRNGVRCGSIEHKMGIRGSATCVLNFDDAVGWLVGEENKGMRGMFTLMNAARLSVGVQGLGLAEVSRQNAVAYARDRVQGRAPGGAKDASQEADPIIVHPDVRRLLLGMRAFTEGARALAGWVGMLIDIAERHPDDAEREAAEDLVALMTPIVKAHFTDVGFTATNLGLQVLGGHGYIREWGMEQYVRDARIGLIYEGTNHVQALDLVGRKLAEGNGRLVRRFFDEARRVAAGAAGDESLGALCTALAASLGGLEQASRTIAVRAMASAEEAGAAASDYLRMFGIVALATIWLRTATVASRALREGTGSEDRAFYEAKLITARFYFAKLLPEWTALLATIESGAESVMAMPADAI